MPHSDATDPKDRAEEDVWNARETLGRLVYHQWPQVPEPWRGTEVARTWQAYLMYLLTPVSRHYGVDKDKVLGSFTRNYMPSILMSAKHGNDTEETRRLAIGMLGTNPEGEG
jgi:hypothetical protein